jgi:hypothetical protein
MRLKVRVPYTEIKEIDVEFPIYAEHDMDDTVIYRRTDANGNRYAIWIRDKGEPSIELSRTSFTDGSDYALGKGDYASTKEKFEEAKTELLEAMKGL